MLATLTYTTVTSVKRVLRSNVQKRVNFPGQIRNFGANPDNVSDISLSNVSFLDSYASQEKVSLVFTDSTTYSIISIDEVVGVRGEINYGTTDIFSDFTTANGIIIEGADWSGSPATPEDEIVFETEVHMNLDDATEYIRDSEIFVDAYLKRAVYQDTSVALNALLFDSTAVPDDIGFVTARLASFFIFNDVYTMNIEGLHSTNPKGLDLETPLNWYQLALVMLNNFIRNYNNQEQQSGPRWYSFDRLLTSRGMADIGAGIAIPQLDNAPDILFDSEFDDLLEPEIAINIFDTIRRDL